MDELPEIKPNIKQKVIFFGEYAYYYNNLV